MQQQQKTLLRLIFMGIMIALGVVISPLLRVEGMCPMAHLINICCAVLLGPADALLCAFLIGVIRMVLMGIPPLALTGAVFGAFLSGLLYRASGGKLVAAFLGEVFGTGVIGALVSYPVRPGRTYPLILASFCLYGTHHRRQSCDALTCQLTARQCALEDAGGARYTASPA